MFGVTCVEKHDVGLLALESEDLTLPKNVKHEYGPPLQKKERKKLNAKRNGSPRSLPTPLPDKAHFKPDHAPMQMFAINALMLQIEHIQSPNRLFSTLTQALQGPFSL